MVFSIKLSFDNFPHKELFAVEYEWQSIARIGAYLKTRKPGKIESPLPAGVFLENPELISIGPNCIIESGAFLRGPCIIGANCEIRNGAYIRGDVITGRSCVIGHSTEVKNSIFLDGARAAHFAYVGDSILGGGVNLGAGVKCANFRLNQSNIIIHHGGRRVDTGTNKLGAIIGDGAQIGCNCVLNPGTVVGENSVCCPGLVVSGFVPADSFVQFPPERPRLAIIKKRGV